MAIRTAIVLACAGSAAAFAPGAVPALGLRRSAQVTRGRASPSVGPKMMVDPSVISDAVQHLSTMETIPFIDEVTGDPQGFTAPVNHFASVSWEGIRKGRIVGAGGRCTSAHGHVSQGTQQRPFLGPSRSKTSKSD